MSKQPSILADAPMARLPLVTASSSERLSAAIERMQSKAIHHLVVVDGGEVRGVLSDRDVFDKALTAQGGRLSELSVGDVMVQCTACVTEETSLAEVLSLMRSLRTTGLPVVQAGALAGIVTETDLLLALRRVLESAGGDAVERAVDDVVARSQRALANPLVQSAMRLLAEAGI